jgi:hypothetical protein
VGPARAPARLLACTLGALTLLTACGGGGNEGTGDLSWSQQPEVARHPTLPDDRVLRGSLRNDSLRRIRLSDRDLRLLDEDGRRVRAAVRYAAGFVRGIYPPARSPQGGVPEAERLRTGQLARIDPGKTVPVTISWRVPAGAKPPVRVEYRGGSLPIPPD